MNPSVAIPEALARSCTAGCRILRHTQPAASKVGVAAFRYKQGFFSFLESPRWKTESIIVVPPPPRDI